MKIRAFLPVVFTLIAVCIPLKSAALSWTIDVTSTTPWTDTGIDLVAGQQLEITATGIVRFDTTSPSGADANGVGPGWDGTQTRPGDPLPTAIHLSLIGRIGDIAFPSDSGAGFVGSLYNGTVDTSGRLYLGFNDDYYVDNSGAFSVTITATEKVPDAGTTLALLAVSICALTGVHFVRANRRHAA